VTIRMMLSESRKNHQKGINEDFHAASLPRNSTFDD